jgi:uncharacterized repeat protein (TIGR02543 family)
MGVLYVESRAVTTNNNGGGAGIGGHGGTGMGGASGSIYIYGGHIEVRGGEATGANNGGAGAGIGGGGGGNGGAGGGASGLAEVGGSFGPIFIYGGIVQAIGGSKNANNGGGGAGIGGGAGGNSSGGGSNYLVDIQPLYFDWEDLDENGNPRLLYDLGGVNPLRHDNLRVFAQGGRGGANGGIGGAAIGGGGGDGVGGDGGFIIIDPDGDFVDSYCVGLAICVGDGGGNQTIFTRVQEPPSSVNIREHGSIDVSFIYTSSLPNPRYQWFQQILGGQVVPVDGASGLGTTALLSIPYRPAGQFRYYCVAEVNANPTTVYSLTSSFMSVNVSKLYPEHNVTTTPSIVNFGSVLANDQIPTAIQVAIGDTEIFGRMVLTNPYFEVATQPYFVITSSPILSRDTVRGGANPLTATFTVRPTAYAMANPGTHNATLLFTATDQSYAKYPPITPQDSAPQTFTISIPVTISVTQVPNVGEFTVDLSDRTYNRAANGVEVTPAPDVGAIDSVRYKINESDLDYMSAPPQNAGEYHVYVYAAGSLLWEPVLGLHLGSYRIVPKSLDADDIVITLSQETYVYDGTEHEPTLTVAWNRAGGLSPVMLAVGTDYIIGYVDNENVGRATVIVTAVNPNLKDAKEDTFRITRATLPDFKIIVDTLIPGTALNALNNNILKLTNDAEDIFGDPIDDQVEYDIITTDPSVASMTDDDEITIFRAGVSFNIVARIPESANYFEKVIVLPGIIAEFIPVVNEPVNPGIEEVIYVCDLINLSDLFELDPEAGAATYWIAEGTGTGVGIVTGSMLNVTALGTGLGTPPRDTGDFTIKVITAATYTHAAGAEATALLRVFRRELTTTARAVNRMYDGTTFNISIVDAVLENVCPGDNVNLTMSSTGWIHLDDANVGNNKEVRVAQMSLIGNFLGRYKLIDPDLRVDILPRPLAGTVTVTPLSGTIGGQIAEGTVLQFNVTNFVLPGLPLPEWEPRWYVTDEDGDPVLSGVGLTYTVTEDDMNREIDKYAEIYVVLETLDANYEGSLTSNRVTAGFKWIEGDIFLTYEEIYPGAPPKLDQTITLDLSGMIPDTVVFGRDYDIIWSDVAGVVKEDFLEYVIQDDDLGTTITVEVVGTGGYTGSRLAADLFVPAIAPHYAPQNFTAVLHDSLEYIQFTWTKPEHDGGSPIQVYQITHCERIAKDPNDWTTMISGPNHLGVFALGYSTWSIWFPWEFGKEYTFYVRAVNDVGGAQAGKGVADSLKIVTQAPKVSRVVISGGNAITEHRDELQMSAATFPATSNIPPRSNQEVTWSLNPTGAAASIDPTGLLTAGGVNETVIVRAMATDGTFVFTTQTVNISGQIGPPTITSNILPAGTFGDYYTHTLSATNGGGTIEWFLPTPELGELNTLPEGLTFDAETGIISGTPTRIGTFSINVGINNEETEYQDEPVIRILTLTINPAVISDYVITLAEPVAGGTPQTTVTSAENQFTGTVDWSPALNQGQFTYFEEYTATIVLTPAYGYTLTGVPLVSFNVPNAEISTYFPAIGTVIATFERTEQWRVDIPALLGVDVPTVYARPAQAIEPTFQYTGTIEWRVPGNTSGTYIDTLASTSRFDVNTVYIAVITLTPATSFSFVDLPTNFFTVEGAVEVYNTIATEHEGAGSTVQVFATFPRTRKIEDILTIDLSAIEGIAVPVVGATPVKTVIETNQYTGTVRWEPDHTTFQYGTEYRAIIVLEAKTPYTFEGVPRNFFDVGGAITVTNAPNSGVVTAIFPKTKEIGDTDPIINPSLVDYPITGVPVPKYGDPTAFAIPSTAQYTATATWSPEVGTEFDHNTVYTAIIVLTPRAGFTTEGLSANFFKVDGATSVTNPVNSGVIRAVFPKTDQLVDRVIGNIIPVAQALVSADPVETNQYTATVVWKDSSSNTILAAGTPFAFNTAYIAEISLTAKEGYTVLDIPANWFEVYGARTTTYEASAENPYSSGIVTAVFPRTSLITDQTITTNIIHGIAVPTAYGTPSRNVNPGIQFGGTVEWIPEIPAGGMFDYGTAYTAVIRLINNPGWTFEGVPENYFIVAGALSVTNFEHSGIVTAVFPATTRDGDQTVTELLIKGVTPPAGAERAVTEIFGSQYNGTITWSPALDRGFFTHNTEYTATIILTPHLGWTMEGVGANYFEVEGAITTSNLIHSGIVTAVFPRTGLITDQTVTINIVEGIGYPVVGQMPITEFDIPGNDQYRGTVEWIAEEAGEEERAFQDYGEFHYRVVYTAIITLEAKEGYRFGGVPQNFFIVPGAEAMSNAQNSGIITATFPRTMGSAGITLINIAEIPGVAAPVVGEAPVALITETAQYTGVVTWYPPVPTGERFDYGTVYTAIITIMPKEGFTYGPVGTNDGIAANFFTVNNAEAYNYESSGVVRAIFPITDRRMTREIGYVVPVADELPLTTLETEEFTAELKYTYTGGAAVDGKFDFNTAYSVEILMTPKPGYTVFGMEKTYFVVLGAIPGSTEIILIADGEAVIKADFPPTRKVTDQTITLFEILGVEIPIADQKPVTTITETDQYTGTVEWIGVLYKDNFDYSTVYTAVITLKLKEGYTFEGVPENAYTVEGAQIVRNSPNTGIITAIFPSTETVFQVDRITIETIQGVTVPCAGEIAVATITPTDQYTGKVTWYPALIDGKFAYDTEYIATIVITPQLTYTTVGLSRDFFVVPGAVSTTNPPNGSVITAKFPKTAKESDVTVNIAIIQGVTPPMAGQIPVITTLENAQYTGTVTWKPEDNPFGYDKVYTATIWLTAKEGFTMGGVKENFFIVPGAVSTVNPINSGFVTATFTATRTDGTLRRVIFAGNGGSPEIVETQDVPVNTTAAVPTTTPTRNGYAFTGWYTEPTAETQWNFNANVTQDMYLYAGWLEIPTDNLVVVTFIAEGGYPRWTVTTIPANTPVDVPTIEPTRTGYALTGWYIEPTAVTQWNFSANVPNDMTLYAGWLAIPTGHVTVTFIAEQGYPRTIVVTVPENTTVGVPTTIPARDGYTFTGWYTEPTAVTQWNFNTNVTQNMNLYAGWLEIPTGYVVVTFVAEEGHPRWIVKTVPQGTPVAQPDPEPVYENYVVEGWYNRANDNKWDFTHNVNTDLELYAKWTIDVQYTVNVTSNNSLLGTATGGATNLILGDYIDAVAEPNSNFVFVSWTIGGTVVSTDPTFRYTITEESDTIINIVANFAIKFEDYVVVKWGTVLMLNLTKTASHGIIVNTAQWLNGIIPLASGLTYTAGSTRNALRQDFDYRFVLQTINMGIIPSTVYDGSGLQNESLSGYPNPVISGEALTIQGAPAGSQVSIFNQSGSQVFSTRADHEGQITINVNLPAGTYVVRTDDGTLKITVQ